MGLCTLTKARQFYGSRQQQQVGTQLMSTDTEEQKELHSLTELVKKMLQINTHWHIKLTEVLQHLLFC